MAAGSIAGFLMEAWEGLVGLEEAVSGLDATSPDASREAEAPREALVGLAHRLERSASAHGFSRLGELARSLGRLARHLPPREHSSFADVRQLLGDTLSVLPMVFDNLAAEGREDIPQLAGIQWRYDAEVAAAEELASERAVAEAPGPIDRALDRFRDDDPEALAFFGPEAAEHLDGIAVCLDRLRSADRSFDRGAVVNTLFRHVHTLKGAAFTVGCEAVGHLAHAIEDNLVPVRQGERSLSAVTLYACSTGLDLLHAMLARLVGSVHDRGSGLQTRYDAVMAALVDLSRGLDPDAEMAAAAEQAAATPTEASYDPISVDTSVTEAMSPATRSPDPTAADESTGVFRPPHAVDGDGTGGLSLPLSVPIALERLDQLFDLAAEATALRSGLADRVGALQATGADVAAGRDRLAHALKTGDGASVISRSREVVADLDEIGRGIRATLGELDRDLKRLRGVAARLRSGLGRLRQVAVGPLFERLERAARHAAADTGREIVVDRVGDAVEVDDAVLEQVAEALGHLVRNAVYHGLEDEAERLDAGKSRRGRLTLSARARGRTVRLSVADDGRGLDPDALRRRAVELGLVTAEHVDALDDAAARELIYQPGLSTVTKVSTGAGRGVGMDAVRHAVGRLGGEVRVESATGRGTRFVLDLPASLRVTEALTLRVGEQVFGLPLAGVRRLVHVVDDRVTTDGARQWLRAGGADLPLISVAERLGIEASGPSQPLPGLRGTAVVVAPTGRPAALWVDDVLGIDEVVIRSLGEFLGAIEPFAGVTLDADGVALLLVDALSLLEDRGESLAIPAPPMARRQPEPTAGRILLVDDSPSVRQVLGQALRSAGFEVVAATDGVEATARWLDGPVDALVTDLEMPRRDGETLIGEIRRLSTGRHVPIIVLSTLADAERLDALRVDAWFPKPVTEAALVDRLRELVAVRGGG